MKLNVWSDSDWAGCKSTRRSTSGIIICLGDSPMKISSSTQRAVALSSMEAEYYALVKSASQAIGIKQMLRDIHVYVDIQLKCDNSSGVDFSKRRGLGKTKHLNTGLLWLQDAVENKEVQVQKIPTETNIADLMTKYLQPNKREHLLTKMNMYYFEGQHELALRCK